MKRNSYFIFTVLLALGDIFSLTLGFTLAYILRVKLSPDEIANPIPAIPFITTVLALIPLWIIVFFLLGLYKKSVTSSRFREFGRLFFGSAISLSLMLAYNYFLTESLFPARLVPVYAFSFSFLILLLVRSLIRFFFRLTRRLRHTLTRVAIIGNDPATTNLLSELYLHSGEYTIVAVISQNKFIPPKFSKFKVSSLAEAIKTKKPDLIFQTDSINKSKVYQTCIDHHLSYAFVAPSDLMLSSNSHTDFIGNIPVISIAQTPLVGWGRVVKRLIDLIFGLIALIITSPFILLCGLLTKISDPSGPIFYKQKRLSLYGKPVDIFKIRSMKAKYSGLSPEDAFTKMGKPQLAQKYREQGDYLEYDPRVTKIGSLLRKTSLDELPQFWNIIKGDISFVGPRSLVPEELVNFPNKNLILSVKSGLTGLAQVSGRRDIPFEERRAIDIYYVQNWSVLLDIKIILQTVLKVLTIKGAK